MKDRIGIRDVYYSYTRYNRLITLTFCVSYPFLARSVCTNKSMARYKPKNEQLNEKKRVRSAL